MQLQQFNECKEKLDLKIFGKNIPKQDNPKYLGIHLDHNLNFKHHIQELKNKCLRKLNFIKILKSKKWHAKIETKTRIYKSMIRSNIDFAGPLLENISPVDKQQLESIQYHSMVQILRLCRHQPKCVKNFNLIKLQVEQTRLNKTT